MVYFHSLDANSSVYTCSARGSLKLDNVAFSGCGQVGTGRPAIAINDGLTSTSISNSTFSETYMHAVVFVNAAAGNFTSNVIYNTIGSSLRIENTLFKGESVFNVHGNLATGAVTKGLNQEMSTVANFAFCPYVTACVVRAENNVAAGSEYYGFVSKALPYALQSRALLNTVLYCTKQKDHLAMTCCD